MRLIERESGYTTGRSSAMRGATSRGGTLLVVEDDPALREMVADNFRMAGYGVREAGDVAEARALVDEQLPSLVLLDWMLPDGSGFELLRSLRRDDRTAELPVIMLTARSDEPDRVRGLDGGADDYVGKPFSLRELEARVRALLRRSPTDDNSGVYEAGGLKVDVERHTVTANGDIVNLGPTEFRLLCFLMSHPERVFSRTQLLDQVWGIDAYIEERTVDVHIRRLRKNLEAGRMNSYVVTVRGFGYRFAVS